MSMSVRLALLVFVWASAMASAALAQVSATGDARQAGTSAPENDAMPAPEPALDEERLRADFDRATGAMAAGEHQRAAAQLEALADKAPGHALAADALFTAAQLYEERLTDPLRARDLYLRLLRDHPNARTALAARRRVDALIAALGDTDEGAEALARFTDILQHYTERGEDQSLDMAENLLREHSAWVGRTRVLRWMGEVHARAGRYTQALDHFQAAIKAAPAGPEGDDARFAAYRGAGDAALAQGHFDAAEDYFRAMPTGGDASREHALDYALERVARQRLRATLYWISFAVLIAVALLLLMLLRTSVSSWGACARALSRPPLEVLFMAPIAALLIAGSLTAHYAIAPAVTIISVGGLAITWISGAGLLAARARAPGTGWLRPLAHALATVLAVVALTYIALHHNRLIDMIVDTVRFGPDV